MEDAWLLLIWPGGRKADRVLARELADAGVGIIEYRPEGSEEDAGILRALGVLEGAAPLLLNNRVDLADAADGVWVGEGDCPVAEARERLSEGAVVGRTVRSMGSLRAAERAGADLVAVGALAPSALKPEAPLVGERKATEMAGAAGCPCFGVGGVTLSGGGSLKRFSAWGFSRFAVSGAILDAENPPREAARWQAWRRAGSGGVPAPSQP